METAAGNSAGAMTGFMGMNMAGNAMGGGFNAAQGFYNMGVQNQQAAPAQDGWKCACGAVATGKFCTECGAKKPSAGAWKCVCGQENTGKFCSECGAKKPQIRCDKCGWEPENPAKAPKFCPECGDPITGADLG
jgi:membrane protease subunit (stomatin/prohibitin family)